MPKRSSKSTDVNQLAAAIVGKATETPAEGSREKNPAAVALGHLGGIKGGPARAASLSATKRKQIAKRAAEVRWNRTKEGGF
jgi:hypothetical protein